MSVIDPKVGPGGGPGGGPAGPGGGPGGYEAPIVPDEAEEAEDS